MVEIVKDVAFVTMLGCFSVILITVTVTIVHKAIEYARGK